jgi:hypothetical protein
MPRPFARCHRNAKHGLRKVNARSAAATLSAVVAHAAAIGVLLTIRPQPYPAPTEEMIEVSFEPEAPDRRRSNEPSGAIPGDRQADASATAGPSNGPGGVTAGYAFSVPARPAFELPAQFPLSDALRRMLDCLAQGSNDRAAARRRDLRSPCLFAGLPLRAPVMPSTNGSESNENGVRAGDDYRHFKPERPMFDESLLPDKVPEANRALKSWFAGLFR